MSVGAFFDKIIMFALAGYFIYKGIQTNKKHPDKTIKIFKPVKLGKFLTIAGIILIILNLSMVLFS